MKTILQVPLSKELKNTAEKEALSQGFSSLQEVVRVFLSQLAHKNVEISLQKSVSLSSKNEQRYLEMTDDFKKNKNVNEASDVDDLLMKLHENSLS